MVWTAVRPRAASSPSTDSSASVELRVGRRRHGAPSHGRRLLAKHAGGFARGVPVDEATARVGASGRHADGVQCRRAETGGVSVPADQQHGAATARLIEVATGQVPGVIGPVVVAPATAVDPCAGRQPACHGGDERKGLAPRGDVRQVDARGRPGHPLEVQVGIAEARVSATGQPVDPRTRSGRLPSSCADGDAPVRPPWRRPPACTPRTGSIVARATLCCSPSPHSERKRAHARQSRSPR